MLKFSDKVKIVILASDVCTAEETLLTMRKPTPVYGLWVAARERARTSFYPPVHSNTTTPQKKKKNSGTTTLIRFGIPNLHPSPPATPAPARNPHKSLRHRRGFTMVKNFRKRSLESDAADNSDDEDTRRYPSPAPPLLPR